MARRQGLVLEARVDKNGNPVKRWVRPADPRSDIPFPAPSVDAKRGGAEVLLTRARDELRLGAVVLEALGEASRRYSEDTLSLITDALESSSDPRFSGGLIGMTIHRYAEPRTREFIAFAPRMHEDDQTFEWAEAAVRALHEYDESVVPQLEDFTEADEQTKAVCRALVSVAYGLTNLDPSLTDSALTEIDPAEEGDDGEYEPEEQPMPAIKDWGLVRLIQEHPEDADDIVTLIGRHGFESAERLREMLYEGSRPLTGGYL